MILVLVEVGRSLRTVMARICNPGMIKIVKGVSAEAPFFVCIKKITQLCEESECDEDGRKRGYCWGYERRFGYGF